MIYTAIQACRICRSLELRPILHLGEQALTGLFPKDSATDVEQGPLELVKCDEQSGGCGLVQLRHSYVPEKMYGENYGYRSGLNRSMVEHLQRRVAHALRLARPQAGDLILDIGSNDGTTLSQYSGDLVLVGMDPTGRKFAHYYPPHIKLIPDFFNADTFAKALPGRQAKIITSIAMFYDLESPLDFMAQIHRVLAHDGIWVFEQSYCPTMLVANAYDTICHEHISYYSLRQIKWMTDRAGFKIVDVELNDVNGGSFCLTVAKTSAPYPAADARVAELLAEEDRQDLSTTVPYQDFARRVLQHRDSLIRLVKQIHQEGKTIHGYGASTKGNVVLQYCGFTARDIPLIAEVNQDKYGAFTPGTKIPICSEQEVRARNPDYLLILPWHFRNGIVKREAEYLARGGKLVFPLPALEIVVDPTGQRRAA